MTDPAVLNLHQRYVDNQAAKYSPTVSNPQLQALDAERLAILQSDPVTVKLMLEHEMQVLHPGPGIAPPADYVNRRADLEKARL